MTHDQETSPPSDVCLLLRAHAEQRWLSLEVGPVLRQLQQRDWLPEEQLGAALAYLEVLWIEASQRAAETDAAYAELEACERAAKADAACAQPDATGARRMDAAQQGPPLPRGRPDPARCARAPGRRAARRARQRRHARARASS